MYKWKIFACLFVLIMFSMEAVAQTVINPGESVSVRCSGCAPVPVCPPCDSCCSSPAPTPVATPVPTPIPTPIPTQPPVSGKIVAKDGSGDYTSISSALAAAKSGDVINVKYGVYNEGFTVSLPNITLRALPGYKPVIEPNSSLGGSKKIYVSASSFTIDGFEIRKGYDGIKAEGNAHGLTVANCYIHDNAMQGILLVEVNNSLIQNNYIEHNGNDYCKLSGKYNNKLCHGVYLSSYTSKGMSGTKVLNNTIKGHGGFCLHYNGEGGKGITNTVLEKNKCIDNAMGITLYQNVSGALVKNNEITVNTMPATTETTPMQLYIVRSQGNQILDNKFASILAKPLPLIVEDSISANNTVNGNTWLSQSNQWYWKGSYRTDFKSKYKSITGWDADGTVN